YLRFAVSKYHKCLQFLFQVYGDVFRHQHSRQPFSILVGSGVQLSFVVLCLILLAMSVDMNGERAGLVSAAIFLYFGVVAYRRIRWRSFIFEILFSVNCYYSSNNGQAASPRWIRQGVAQALLPPSLICGVAFPVNLVAVGYHSSRSLTPSQGLSVLAIVTFALLPLSLIGTLLGRNLCGRPSKLPCRLNAVPRPLPEKRHCLAEPPIICLLGGLLPFASIFVEMYYVFTSFWAYKIYYVYGFSFLAFALLLCATACVTIVCVYFLLNSEDYRWQWCSFMAGASTAVYLYVYAVYYFFFKTRMYGLYQTAFYFSFMALFCCGLALICGAVGFLAASLFVRTIYANVKTD
uniref:Transmembrane 9 superfamily member n=1 Tax=Macrostomum lignano TaxID=282301 RepID=A0A1I8FSN4_9PLAT